MNSPILLLKSNNGIPIDSNLFILDTPIIKIGRDSSADLKLQDPFISRLQAEIYKEHEKWFIRDIQSKNGTFLNGNRIDENPIPLKQGDIISFSQKIEFLYQDQDIDSAETRSMIASLSPYGIEIIEKSEDVIVDGIKINPRLGPQEYKFLSLLLEKPEEIHTYKELAKRIFNITEDVFYDGDYKPYLQSYKNEIVRKFHKQGITREVIKSRSNVGYILVEKEKKNS